MSGKKHYYGLRLSHEQAELVHDGLLELKNHYRLFQADESRIDNIIQRLGREIGKTKERNNISEKFLRRTI